MNLPRNRIPWTTGTGSRLGCTLQKSYTAWRLHRAAKAASCRRSPNARGFERGLWLRFASDFWRCSLPTNRPSERGQICAREFNLHDSRTWLSALLRSDGSWSRCAILKSRRLSMNRKMPLLISNGLGISGSWPRFASVRWRFSLPTNRSTSPNSWTAGTCPRFGCTLQKSNTAWHLHGAAKAASCRRSPKVW